MDDNDSTSENGNKPAANPGETIPVLPLMLGAGAILFGVVLFAIVWGSSQSKRQYVPPSLTHDAGNP